MMRTYYFTQRRNFTGEQLAFIKAHLLQDMNALQLAVYFDCHIHDIDLARRSLGIKLTKENMRMTRFHTPYPCQIAKSVRKFNWDNYLKDNPNGKIQAHSAHAEDAGRSALPHS